MPDFSLVGSSSQNRSSSTTITLSKPAGVSAGTYASALILRYDSADLLSAPSGWVERAKKLGTYSAWLYDKVLTASEPSSYVWTWADLRRCSGGLVAFDGDYDQSDPIYDLSNVTYSNYNTIVRAASVNVPVNDSLVIYYGTANNYSVTKPSGWEDGRVFGNTDSDVYGCMSWDILPAGASGNIDGTAATTTNSKHAFAIALRGLPDSNLLLHAGL